MNKCLDMQLFLEEILELYKSNTNTNYMDINEYINKINSEINLISIQSNFYKNKKEYEKKGILIIPCQDYLSIRLPDKWGIISSSLFGENNFMVYLSIEKDNIYDVSLKIIEFMYDNDIEAEYRIYNYYREKVVSIAFIYDYELKMVIKFINDKLKKKLCNFFNPFIPSIGKLNVCIDGKMGYDACLFKLIDQYIREKDIYEDIGIDEFYDFIQEEIILLEKKRDYFSLVYDIDGDKYCDFIVLVKMIGDNIKRNLDIDDIGLYRVELSLKKNECFSIEEVEKKYKNAVRSIFDILLEFYDNDLDVSNSIEKMHEVIMEFINTRDYACFPNYKGIREVVNKLGYDRFKNYMLEIGKDTLFRLCVDTRMKYGDIQLKKAVLEAEKTGELSSFTNFKGNRSELGIVLPSDLLKEIIENDFIEMVMNS